MQNDQSSLDSGQNILRQTSPDSNSVPVLSRQSSITGSSKIPRTNSSQLLAQRKLFAESQAGRSSFRKLLEPSSHQRPGIAPYRVVLGNVMDKVHFPLALIFITKAFINNRSNISDLNRFEIFNLLDE